MVRTSGELKKSAEGYISPLEIYLSYMCRYFFCICVWCPLRKEEVVGSPRTAVTDGCEALCGCWELNLCSLKDHPVFLTTEQSLQTISPFSDLPVNENEYEKALR